MGKGVKDCVELIMCEEECGCSFKEARGKKSIKVVCVSYKNED